MIALAGMAALDEDALICDFAETYHVFDLWGLPPDLAATLAAGLGPSSRITRRRMGISAPCDTVLLSMAVDRLSMIAWLNSRDGQEGTNRPKPITAMWLEGEQETAGDFEVFEDADAFEEQRRRILEEL